MKANFFKIDVLTVAQIVMAHSIVYHPYFRRITSREFFVLVAATWRRQRSVD